MTTDTQTRETAPHNGAVRSPATTVTVLSVLCAVLMAAAAAAGVLVSGLYHESGWAAGALRGGDLVTLLVVVPAVTAAVWLARRGSARAELVWAAMLVYNLYNYTYIVFGTAVVTQEVGVPPPQAQLPVPDLLPRTATPAAGYLTRPYIVYRSRDPQLGIRSRRRGWGRVGS